MSRTPLGPVVAVVVVGRVLAGCGGGGGGGAIDAAAVVDADLPIDAAPACAPVGYPVVVIPVARDLAAPFPLSLDGNGDRCGQIQAALLDPARQPPELAGLDTTATTFTCERDPVTDREIVRARVTGYQGLHLFGLVQDALVHVDARDVVVFLHADFLPTGATVADACQPVEALRAAVVGAPLDYQRFAACTPQGAGRYPIAADDERVVGREGYFVDGDGRLRRVREVEVYLAPAHVDGELINSDLYCCTGPGVDHCVGRRMLVDALTGEVVGSEARCVTC